MEFNSTLLIIGLLFLAVGIVLLVKQLKSKKNNTESVTARVVDYHTEISHDSDTETRVFYPIMRYCVDGQWYEKKSDIGKGKKQYGIGEEVEILYNPNNPEKFIISGDKTPLIAAVIAMAIGVVIVIFAFS